MNYEEIKQKYDGKIVNIKLNEFTLNNIKIKVSPDSVSGYDRESWNSLIDCDLQSFVKIIELNQIEIVS